MFAGFLVLKPTHAFRGDRLAFEPAANVLLLAVAILAGRRNADIARNLDLPSRGVCVSVLEYTRKRTNGEADQTR